MKTMRRYQADGAHWGDPSMSDGRAIAVAAAAPHKTHRSRLFRK